MSASVFRERSFSRTDSSRRSGIAPEKLPTLFVIEKDRAGIEMLFTASLIYWVLSMGLEFGQSRLERRFARSLQR